MNQLENYEIYFAFCRHHIVKINLPKDKGKSFKFTHPVEI